jgi:ABC-type transporter Mla subunit MlaD
LPDYILEVTTDKVTADYPDQAETSKKLKYIVKDKDLVLNDAYRNALQEVLYGNDVKSIDDAINLLFHVLFPVEYKDWALEVINTANKTYDIEVGTNVSLNPNTLLGNIVINLHQGNRGDSI